MEFKIVGAGQSCDFSTGKLVDQISVRLPDGTVRTILTDSETVKQLVELRFGSASLDHAAPPPIDKSVVSDAVARMNEISASQEDDDAYAPGASIFGGSSSFGVYEEEDEEDVGESVSFSAPVAKLGSVYDEEEGDIGDQI